jgi:hypothetical protein
LRLKEGAEKSRVEIKTGGKGSPSLALQDADGHDRAYLQVHDDIGGVSFGLQDDRGGVRILAAVGPDGTSGLGLMDDAGETRVDLKVHPSGAVAIHLYDKDAKARTASSIVLATRRAGGVKSMFRDAR